MITKKIQDYLHFSQPTKEQVSTLTAIEKFVSTENQDDFLILSGAAGTGKTSIISALIGLLNATEIRYKVAAPTGRAARILGRKSNTTASTLHSLIYNASENENTGKVAFKLKEPAAKDYTVYIIDEASMIPKNKGETTSLFEAERGLLFDLLEYTKAANVSNKILFIGDRNQLPPVNEKESFALNIAFLESTFNLKGSEHLLTEIKRQEDGSYILENSKEIREAIDNRKNIAPIRGHRSKSIYDAADNFVRDVRKDGLENQVAISVSHKANKFFNDLVRQRLHGRAKKILEIGDLLLVVQNWRRNAQNLYNGDHVKLVEVDLDNVDVVAGLHFVPITVEILFGETQEFVEAFAILDCLVEPGGHLDFEKWKALRHERYTKNKIYRDSKLPGDDRYVGALQLVYGNAITCQKAQGGEWEKVYINTLGIPSLKWQYTAVTRGKSEIERF